jgi:preprotein translocase subunit SecD
MHYPAWKYGLIAFVILIGLIYSLPNLFGEDPAVQVIATQEGHIKPAEISRVEAALKDANITSKSFSVTDDDKMMLIRFHTGEAQLKANELIKATLGDTYAVALNLATATPPWLTFLGAAPMKLGLDLRGGVHFLLAIDVDSLIQRRMTGDVRNISDLLRDKRLRYASLNLQRTNRIHLNLRDLASLDKAEGLLRSNYPDLLLTRYDKGGKYELIAELTPTAKLQAQNYAVEQTTMVLRNRINELGVAEPIVQRQGADRIVVDLPGIQETAKARQILGGTATIEMHMVNVTHDVGPALKGRPPAGSRLYDYDGVPYLIKNQVILSGTSITGAVSTFDEQGRPAVAIKLGGGGEALFYRETARGVGKPMAIVYVETSMESKKENGKTSYIPHKTEKVIEIANINEPLRNDFQITGIPSNDLARDLALILRAGALPAPISIIEESTVGPSLGKENIDKGVLSVVVGAAVVILFMALYYRLFGLIADVTLLLNLVLLVALLSILGATLTLPGIAGIVLTLGMAVDANVLIFERIREELRNGVSPHASIQAGFDKALTTIVDANVTTLIAAMALFALGTGAVKGFAVTLTLGLLTSMFTAITVTRGLVYFVYAKRNSKKLSIGI